MVACAACGWIGRWLPGPRDDVVDHVPLPRAGPLAVVLDAPAGGWQHRDERRRPVRADQVVGDRRQPHPSHEAVRRAAQAVQQVDHRVVAGGRRRRRQVDEARPVRTGHDRVADHALPHRPARGAGHDPHPAVRQHVLGADLGALHRRRRQHARQLVGQRRAVLAERSPASAVRGGRRAASPRPSSPRPRPRCPARPAGAARRTAASCRSRSASRPRPAGRCGRRWPRATRSRAGPRPGRRVRGWRGAGGTARPRREPEPSRATAFPGARRARSASSAAPPTGSRWSAGPS